MTPKLTPTAEIEVSSADYNPGSFIVWTIWKAEGTKLDRPKCYGISCGKSRNLAERLVRAINAGAVFPNPQIAIDINGQTYVKEGSPCKVMGRRLNADLRRLGF